MANENLRDALTRAGITPEELADIVGADARSIRRWLAGGYPYARHRRNIARALYSTEQQLWPQHARQRSPTPAPVTPAPAATSDPLATDAAHARTTAALSEELIGAASRQIDIADDYSGELLGAPGLIELLIAKAGQGCPVRLLLCFGELELLPRLLDRPGIEIRFFQRLPRPITHRGDDRMLAWEWLEDPPADPSLMLDLRAGAEGGLFARLADRFQQLWEQEGEPVESEADIEENIAEWDADIAHPAWGDEDDEDENEDADDDRWPQDHNAAPHDTPGPDARQPEAQQPAAPFAPPDATPARRWPGRDQTGSERH